MPRTIVVVVFVLALGGCSGGEKRAEPSKEDRAPPAPPAEDLGTFEVSEVAQSFRKKLAAVQRPEGARVLCDPGRIAVDGAKADAGILVDQLVQALTDAGLTCVRDETGSARPTHALSGRVKGTTQGASRTLLVTVELIELATRKVVATSIKEFRTTRQ